MKLIPKNTLDLYEVFILRLNKDIFLKIFKHYFSFDQKIFNLIPFSYALIINLIIHTLISESFILK
jgi:hypothetical protein